MKHDDKITTRENTILLRTATHLAQRLLLPVCSSLIPSPSPTLTSTPIPQRSPLSSLSCSCFLKL